MSDDQLDYPSIARIVLPPPLQVLRDQRQALKKVGDLERKNSMLHHKPEDEYWGEEAGRRWGREGYVRRG